MRSLQAGRVTFSTTGTEALPLSEAQAEAVREIVSRFLDRKEVTSRGDYAGYAYGTFRLGEMGYAWQGDALYYRDRGGQVRMVHNARLGRMAERYMAMLGLPPLKELSSSDWQALLAELK